MESKSAEGGDYSSLLTVSIKTDKGCYDISGTLFGAKDFRVVEMAGYHIDIAPTGILLVSPHTDRPGMIGQVGTILGTENINIASMHLGRKTRGENALMVLSVDSEVPVSIIEKIGQIPGIESVKQVLL